MVFSINTVQLCGLILSFLVQLPQNRYALNHKGHGGHGGKTHRAQTPSDGAGDDLFFCTQHVITRLRGLRVLCGATENDALHHRGRHRLQPAVGRQAVFSETRTILALIGQYWS